MMPACNLIFDAIGTNWKIDTPNQLTDTVVQRINKRIDAFDATYSRFRDNSSVRRLAASPGKYYFPSDVVRLISFYRRLYNITDGQFTPLIGSMLEKAGYDAKYTFKTHEQTLLPSWDEAMQWRYREVTTLQPIVLDVGAAGKGYLVDIVCGVLDDAGIGEYIVDASGDMRHKGDSADRVGLEHPLDATKVIGIANVKNASLCASASNRRKWGKGVHHIFNPHTMQPAEGVIATWVIAREAMVADGLATALFLTPPEKLREQFSFEYVRMHGDGAVDYSAKFDGEIFT